MSKSFAQTSKTTSKPEKYSLNRGLKVFKEKGHSAVKSELSQVHNREVFKPQHIKDQGPNHESPRVSPVHGKEEE